MNKHQRLIRKLMVEGLSPKEARERAAEIKAQDAITIATDDGRCGWW